MDGKILVTGSSGFIGKALCDHLASENEMLIRSNSSVANIQEPAPFNIYDNENIKHVVHLASRTFVPDSWQNPKDFFDVNTGGTMKVLEFCRKKNIPLTYISAYVYGEVKVNPIPETLIPQPNNPYALSKKLAEDACMFYADFFKMNISVVRPFNVYGPGQNKSFLIPYIIDQAINGNVIRVKDLVPRRDYIYIDDLVKMIANLCRKKVSGIFNAGFGKSYSVQDVIEKVIRLVGKEISIESEQITRYNEISETVADVSRAEKILGWKAETTLEHGLSLILKNESVRS